MQETQEMCVLSGSWGYPGEGKGYSRLQYSCLENATDREAWRATLHGVMKSRTWLSSVQFSCSVMSDSLWPHGLQHTRPSCPSPTPGIYSNSWPLSQWCYPTISSSVVTFSSRLQSFPASEVFPNESVLWIRRPKYCSFNFSISASNEYSGLISFRMDWLDIVAVQGTLKSLLQHHSSKAPVLWCSAFFIVQLSHPYMTIGKTIVFTRRTFVYK